MKIALTGATGFVGSHLAHSLMQDGHDITLLVRNPKTLFVALKSCATVTGDLLDPASLKKAFADADLVIHAAAYVGEWGTREDYFQNNVDGTRNVIDACAAAKVKRLIHISSNSVYGDGDRDHVDMPEDAPYVITDQPYGNSKIEAEKLVLAAHDAGRVCVTVLRPGLVWGPRDRQFLPKIIDSLSSGTMMYLGGGKKLLGLTHVYNIVDVTRLCLAKKVSHGRVYNVDDDDRRTLGDLVRALCLRLGYREPRFSYPTFLARKTATLMEFTWRMFGAMSPPLLTKMGTAVLCYDNDVSVERAKRELGYQPQDNFDRWLDAYLVSYQGGE